MGQRSRKRSRAPVTPAPAIKPKKAAPEPSTGPEPKPPSRSELRNAEARAALSPLDAGERPGAVTAAAVVAVGLAVANIVLYAAGVTIRGRHTALGGAIIFCLLMLVTAAGMWRARYWAVLGFEALLGVSLVFAGLSLTVANSVKGLIICLVILGPGGFLFWKLIRSMARIQMPERPSRTPR
ncbi:MAG: hypothetical protein ACR2K9_08265 [Solirubrobacteraceae bacterium]